MKKEKLKHLQKNKFFLHLLVLSIITNLYKKYPFDMHREKRLLWKQQADGLVILSSSSLFLWQKFFFWDLYSTIYKVWEKKFSFPFYQFIKHKINFLILFHPRPKLPSFNDKQKTLSRFFLLSLERLMNGISVHQN